MTVRRRAVLDVQIFINAVAHTGIPEIWPSPPPLTDRRFIDTIGIIVNGSEFALCTGWHILDNIAKILNETYDWEKSLVDIYIKWIIDQCIFTGGVIISDQDIRVRVDDSVDFEDNKVLEIVLASEADLLISDDGDILTLRSAKHGWRGIPIFSPTEFAQSVSNARR